MSTNGIKISALPAASAANATDQIEVNQAGTSRRVTVEQLLDVSGGNYLPLAGGTLTGALTGTTATFSGEITAATPLAGENDTTVATTEFVSAAIAAIPPTGSLLTGFWTSNTQAFVPPPATGRVRLSVAWPPSVGASIHLYIHNTDADSLVYTWSVGPTVGDLIVLRSVTGARLDATVTAKSSSTYLDITVTVLATSGTLANNSRCQIAAIQFVSNYLPLAGGTLTGPLNGTVATFSADVSATEYQFSNVSVLKQFFAGFTGVGDPTNGVGGVHVGSATNYHHNTEHNFQGPGGSPTYFYANAGGLVSLIPFTGTTAQFSGNVLAASSTAVAAGANTQCFIKASSTGNLGLYYGTGNPSFSAAKGSIYTKTDATTTTTRLWVNTDGSTTWTTLTTAALRTTLPPSGAIAQLQEEDDGKLFILPLAATGFVSIPLPASADVPPGWSVDLLAIPGSGSIGIQLNAAGGDIINDGADSTAPGGFLRSKSDGAALRLSRVLTGSQAWYVHHKIGNWN